MDSDTGESAGYTSELELADASQPTPRLSIQVKNALEAMAEAESDPRPDLQRWLLEIATAITVAEDIDEEILEVPWRGLSWYQRHALRRCAMSVQSWLSQPHSDPHSPLPTDAILWLWEHNKAENPPKFGFKTFPFHRPQLFNRPEFPPSQRQALRWGCAADFAIGRLVYNDLVYMPNEPARGHITQCAGWDCDATYDSTNGRGKRLFSDSHHVRENICFVPIAPPDPEDEVEDYWWPCQICRGHLGRYDSEPMYFTALNDSTKDICGQCPKLFPGDPTKWGRREVQKAYLTVPKYYESKDGQPREQRKKLLEVLKERRDRGKARRQEMANRVAVHKAWR